jgi:hypothetical protein
MLVKVKNCWIIFLFLLSSNTLFSQQKSTTKKVVKPNDAVYLSQYKETVFNPKKTDTAAFFVERKKQIDSILKDPIPVKYYPDKTDERTMLAQNIALQDSFFIKYIFDRKTHQPMWNEIFGVYPARPGDIRKGVVNLPGSLMRVEMYNYALNLTSIGIVNIITHKMISVDHYPQMQPDIPSSLAKLAVKIAVNAPEVEKALGFKPSADMPIMSSTKTALNRTKCERSQHLCVAPTFVKGNRALWAIVDLTDNRLVGLRWTNVGKDAENIVVTERKLQNENMADCYCEKINTVKKNNWSVDYVLTASDGLMISNVSFNANKIINSAKLVDWHVSYSGTDGFGYSDAVGCPIFSQSAVVATDPPIIADIIEGDSTVGFMLEQRFFSELWPIACNYSYSQRFFFYKNGQFRMVCASLGRGCGNNGIYRPVMRISFAGNKQSFYEWGNNTWNVWEKEKWQLQQPTTDYSPKGFQYKINTGADNGFYIEPGRGQFKDSGRGDNAYLYITKNHLDKNEGETDLVTIGPCCNNDYKQGPEKFIEPNPEKIVDTDLVLWYVPQMKNDDTPGSKYCWAETYYERGVYKIKSYPCFVGPMFVPFKK